MWLLPGCFKVLCMVCPRPPGCLLVPICLSLAAREGLLISHAHCAAFLLSRLLQVKETDSFHLATMAKRGEQGDDILALLPTVEGTGKGSRVHMRSLGFMGSFLLQFSSAQVGGGLLAWLLGLGNGGSSCTRSASARAAAATLAAGVYTLVPPSTLHPRHAGAAL